MTIWDWPNQQVVRADESGPGTDTPPDTSAPYLDTALGTISTPDTSDMVIAGSVRLSIRAQVDAIGAGFPPILTKAGPTVAEREFDIYVYDGNGQMAFSSADAGGTINVDAVIVSPTPLGSIHTYGIDFTRGVGTCWTIVDGIRTPVSLAVPFGVPDTSLPVVIGNAGAAARIYWAQLEQLNAAANPIATLWRFDAAEYPGTGLAYTDPRGRVWSLSASGSIVLPEAPELVR